MIQDNPAWKDQAVMAKEVGGVGKFLVDKYGFTPEEIANHMDARMMRMVRDAIADACADVIVGIAKPIVVLSKSNNALAFGVAVPMPTFFVPPCIDMM